MRVIETMAHVVPMSERFHRRVLPLTLGFNFIKAANNEYSLADCISMATMREYSVNEVLTNDHHFEQEGFVILVK